MVMVSPTIEDLRFVKEQQDRREDLEFTKSDEKALNKLGVPLGDIKKELDEMVGVKFK